MSPKRAQSLQDLQPRLIVISAPSGAGKTTLCEMVLKGFPNIRLSVSTTTRERRPYEKHGIHYFFVSHDDFKRRVGQGEFAEWAQVHGNCYGSSHTQIEKALAEGQHVLFDIDVQGAMSLLKSFGDRVLLVFVHPPSMKDLKGRLVERKGDSETAIETRMRNAYNEVGWSQRFDYQIVNDKLDRAYQELKTILERECR